MSGEEPDWVLGHRMDGVCREAPIAAAVWAPDQVRGTGDAEVARLAERQKGFVHRRQLAGAGIGRGGIEHRLKGGRLHVHHRDVYLVGRPRPEPLGLAMAAVLHFRGHAVVSHLSAAHIWGMVDAAPSVPELTIVGRDARRRATMTVHRARSLDRADLRRRAGLPVTSAPRVLLEIAGRVGDLELENALACCRRERLATDAQVTAAIDRAPHHLGAGLLRRLLSQSVPAALTRSERERRLLSLVRTARLPAPIANARLCGFIVDLFWPEQRLVVEFDSWSFHGDRAAFERDRVRDQVLVVAGYRVIRVTARQLEHESYALIARIAGALAILGGGDGGGEGAIPAGMAP